MALLYDAVAGGMWAYAHAGFRVVVLGPRRLGLAPGTLLVATHRRETDVPVACPPIYFRARLWRGRTARERLSFAARDDLFLRGFFAGFPPQLDPRARRLLYPVGIGGWLPLVHVHPLRSATSARLGEALAAQAGEPLGDALGPQESARFAERAEALGLPRPLRASDVLRGEYADLLWRVVAPDDAIAPPAFWARRAASAAADFRSLVALLRAGGRLLVFPEGRPSPDGEVGLVQRGLGALARRGRPSALLPVGIAYDPLVRGRTRALVHLGDAEPPPAAEIEATATTLLRRSIPLTAGQLVAAGADPDAAIEAARADGRAIDPRLLRPHERAEALAEARHMAPSRPSELAYLAREYRSARDEA